VFVLVLMTAQSTQTRKKEHTHTVTLLCHSTVSCEKKGKTPLVQRGKRRSKFLAQHRGRSSANLISTAQLLLQPIMLMSKERKFRCSPAAERGKERDKQGKGDFVLALALRITKERQQEFAAAREEDIPFAPLSPRLLIALTSCFRSYFLPLDRTTLPVCRITNSKMSSVLPPVWLTGIRGCVPARQQIVAPPLRE